jgi:hypothetical protein
VGDVLGPRICFALKALGDQFDVFGEVDADGQTVAGASWMIPTSLAGLINDSRNGDGRSPVSRTPPCRGRCWHWPNSSWRAYGPKYLGGGRP